MPGDRRTPAAGCDRGRCPGGGRAAAPRGRRQPMAALPRSPKARRGSAVGPSELHHQQPYATQVMMPSMAQHPGALGNVLLTPGHHHAQMHCGMYLPHHLMSHHGMSQLPPVAMGQAMAATAPYVAQSLLSAQPMGAQQFSIDQQEVLAAVETLYTDELKPYGRILRKRLAERVQVSSRGQSVDIDIKHLRAVCESSPWLYVQAEEGGDWSALLRCRLASFVDVYSPQDQYPQELWDAAGSYFGGLDDADMVLPGGRYSCAQVLVSRRLPFLQGRTLGQVCHIVQLAISQKKLLGYLNGAVVPYSRSQSMVKEKCAERGKPCTTTSKGTSTLASWDSVRTRLQEIIATMAQGAEFVPLSNMKRLFRSRFHLELSETALGYAKLSELLQDSRLHDICTVRLQGHGYVVVPLNRGSSQGHQLQHQQQAHMQLQHQQAQQQQRQQLQTAHAKQNQQRQQQFQHAPQALQHQQQSSPMQLPTVTPPPRNPISIADSLAVSVESTAPQEPPPPIEPQSPQQPPQHAPMYPASASMKSPESAAALATTAETSPGTAAKRGRRPQLELSLEDIAVADPPPSSPTQSTTPGAPGLDPPSPAAAAAHPSSCQLPTLPFPPTPSPSSAHAKSLPKLLGSGRNRLLPWHIDDTSLSKGHLAIVGSGPTKTTPMALASPAGAFGGAAARLGAAAGGAPPGEGAAAADAQAKAAMLNLEGRFTLPPPPPPVEAAPSLELPVTMHPVTTPAAWHDFRPLTPSTLGTMGFMVQNTNMGSDRLLGALLCAPPR